MNDIKLLDKNTIDQIAAGEVVERPSSIVKELIENSIDAGADAVSIEIKDGGTSMIRITDNGSGIRADQVRTAFLRHSTSKINNASDLSFIHTLGFRGEALSSVAAVSKTEICTKTSDSLTGIIYKINGGIEESMQEAGLPDGTTMIIRDLFYNTPARLKFLKSAAAEGSYILDVVQRIALSRPDISFKFTSNGTVKLATSGNGSLKDTVYSVFGRDITANLLDVDGEKGYIRVKGFIGKPEIARGNRNYEFFFVNGRFVKDKVIQKSLEDAYAGYQMKGTFPFAIINITMEPELVDVNVHPSKMEIRFHDNEDVYNSLYEILRGRITRRENIPEVSLEKTKNNEDKKNIVSIPEPFETKSRVSFSNRSESGKDEPSFVNTVFNDNMIYGGEKPVRDTQAFFEQISFNAPFISDISRPSHRIIGVIFDTYWLVEYTDKLFIIDQHAAHEKVLYERFMKRIREEKHYSQKITPPEIISLSVRECDTLEKNMDSFRRLGFETEHFGGNEYAISAVPTDLYGINNKVLFVQMLDELIELPSGQGAEIMTDRIATAACKAAVKGGNRLSLAEAERLIDELLDLENPYNCPHGRPTIISMSKYELEKKFKRVI